MDKFITQAQAEILRQRALEMYGTVALDPILRLRDMTGCIGVATIDYYIVADDDPRLLSQSQLCDTKPPSMN